MNSLCFLLVFFALVSACAAQLFRQDSCEPDCFGKNKGDLVEDPRNCTKYYICLGNDMHTDVSIPCTSGEHFDPSLNECVPGTDCIPSCKPIACHLTCNGTLDVISDSKNCSLYYFCNVNGSPIGPLSCPPERPVFDGKNCITDRSKCCENLCIPYCHGDSIQIPDPEDCTKFYICLEEGPPDPSLHFPCDPGEYFDVTNGMCATGTCTPLCSNTTAVITTTTAPVDGCVSSLTCTAIGYFPKCTNCQPGFFECNGVGMHGVEHSCSGNLVFNPDPNYPYCILPSNCPYHP